MQTLIMHGSFTEANSPRYWFGWLKNELVTQGNTVVLEQLPVDSWEKLIELGEANLSSYTPSQSLESWEDAFVTKVLPQIEGKEINFVGHSLANLFILHMLAKYKFTLKRAVFVSPFFEIPYSAINWPLEPINHTFYKSDFDFVELKTKITSSIVVTSDNDPYVPATEPPLFAEKLGSDIKVIPGGRHCGSNFPTFPDLLPLL